MSFSKAITLGVTILSTLALSSEPKVIDTVSQKNKAIDIFLENAEVGKAIENLERDGFKQLSIEALPYKFMFTDEGPASLYLVSAYLGKSEPLGWGAKFVTAKVNTDKFGQAGATVINSDELAQKIRELK